MASLSAPLSSSSASSSVTSSSAAATSSSASSSSSTSSPSSSSAAAAADGAAAATWRTVALAELAAHRTMASCWIAVDGGVFDATRFLDDHPGGPELILGVAGRDATRDFAAVRHSASARSALAELRVGTLPDGEGVRLARAGGGEGGGEGGGGGCAVQ